MSEVFRNRLPVKPSISLVIPVYNSEASLRELSQRIKTQLDHISEAVEILLIDDASSDRSWEIIQQLSNELASVRGIRLFRNSGQHNALLCGIREARYDIVVTMDDDLQHPPEEINKLILRLHEGYDVVYGTPRSTRHRLWRNVSSWATKLFLRRIMDVREAESISAFRAFRTDLRLAFENYASPWTSIDVLLSWGTDRFSSVKVDHKSRQKQRSQYTLKTLIRHAMNMITGFSTAPLRIVSIFGFIATFFGLIVFCFVLVRYLIQGGVVPGFSFLASIIAIFSGMQLFALGMISEYIARIHSRAMDRQPYVIASRTDID